jgi:hypothetical protein
MAFTAKDGSKHTNHDSMKQANVRFGAKPQPAPVAEAQADGDMGDQGAQPEPHHAAIHAHLQQMHAATGEAHSHVEHHGDGTHTSHHVDAAGQVSGPHHHVDAQSLQAKMEEAAGQPQADVQEGY